VTGGDSPAITVAIYAALTYDIISATNSSPQTTEINAQKRAATLMKWVFIGLAQAIFFGYLGWYFERKQNRPGWPPVMGVAIAGSLLWFQYEYAKAEGLKNGGASTETY
jgi:heme/copper-type cytochrome/quinol oxidase subunit 3